VDSESSAPPRRKDFIITCAEVTDGRAILAWKRSERNQVEIHKLPDESRIGASGESDELVACPFSPEHVEIALSSSDAENRDAKLHGLPAWCVDNKAARERVSKPAIPCTPAGIRQLKHAEADKQIGPRRLIFNRDVVPASIRPLNNLSSDNS